MAVTSQNDYFLVSVKAQERGKQENESRSSVFTINDANLSDEWETRRMLVLKNSPELWAIGRIPEAIVVATSQMEVPFTSALPSSVLEVEWNLRPRSSCHEQSGTSPSLNLASKMPSGDNFSSDAQCTLHWDLATKQPFLFPSRTTTAPLVPPELGISHSVVLRMEDTYSLSTLTLKSSLFHNTETTLSLALPDPESPPVELEHALSPSMPATYPSPSVRPHPTLPVSAILQKTTFLELERGIFSPRELNVSLNAGWLESVPLGLWCETAGTAATPQAPSNLADLSPTASMLEPRYTEDLLPARETSFFLINKVTSPYRLPMPSTVEKEMFLSSAYCQHMVSTSKQEDISLIAGLSSGLYSSHQIDLEHQESLIKQPLLGEREGNCFRTAYGEKDDTAKTWDIISKPTLCSSLDRVTLSPTAAWNHFVPELPLVSKEMQSANIAQYDLVISGTSAILLLPHNEMQATAKLLVPLEIYQNLDLPALQAPPSLDNKVTSKAGPHLNCRELGFPWLQVYLPVRSCHAILKNEAGHFSPPVLSRSQTNSWCNWTIWAGDHKHILVYVEGFEGSSNCEEDQDKIIFQGVSSSVESKVAYACRNHGTLIFATWAVAVQVVFLSKSPSQYHSPKHFKGRYYIFADYGTKEPFPKPNSSAELSRKSSIMHLGNILDFLTTRTPNNDSWLPGTTKKSWKDNNRAGTLEAVLRPAASNHTQTPFLKSEENVTLNPLEMKMVHVAKPSFHDTKPGGDSSSGNLKKMLGLESNHLENEDKPFVHNLTGLSTSAHVSQKSTTVTKLVELKDHETTTEPARLQYRNHKTTHRMTTFTENTVKARISFPQVLIEEPRTPTQPPESNLEKRQKPSLQSNSRLSRKNTDVMEGQQHKRLQESLERQQVDNQVSRQENSNRKKNTAVVLAGSNTSQLITETPESSMNRSKSQLTTLDYPDELNDLSLRALNHNLVETASTLNSQVVLSHHPKSIEVETTEIPSLNSSVTGNKEQPPRKYTRANPPYLPSGSMSRNNTSLKVGNDSYERESVSHENDSVLLSQHNPGDLLFEIIFDVEYRGRIPPIGSSQEKTLIEIIKRQIRKKMKPFSDKVKEIKLKEIIRRSDTQIDGQTDPYWMLIFWLHLTPKNKNVFHLVHSQLENLSGTFMEAGKVQTVVVTDVNECNSGIGLCGNEAICLNGYGTYLCKCKEDYEDRSEMKSGTLCVRSPRSGLGSLYSFTEILVGTTVFFISALVVIISVLCTITKKRHTKKDFHFQEAASPGTPGASEPPQTAFDQNNIHHLLTLDPAQLKLRAKAPEWPLETRTGPSETYRVSMEQSDYL
ncbi:hypothetical protein JRQ81_001004 [Phrynocephalus forsythii]|uniref:EGF-like domain-containing protein n=1 Tax=Phrynocephalus forsythii TaxID=171643 RepID=A0A9Q0Y9J5_9SAUR|nr:hypothetical protein JRQ81_001004 [Phrynocephalus forsythii]